MPASFDWDMRLRHPVVTTGTGIRHPIICLWRASHETNSLRSHNYGLSDRPAITLETCASKAVGKNGKPLAGAALNSFLKKCKRETCLPKAVSAEGKKLSGAAKNSFMRKCARSA